MTETRLTTDPATLVSAEAGGGVIWPGVNIFHTSGTGYTGGVCIVLGPGLHLSDPKVFSPPGLPSNNRILRIDLSFYEQPISLLGIYGPAQPEERAAFFAVLPSFLPAHRAILMGGDFNVVLSQHDCWYSAGTAAPRRNSRYVARELLRDIMSTFSLRDVWREHHPPPEVIRTHTVADGASGARLDRFLASPAIFALFPKMTSTVHVSSPIKSDHRPVSVSFSPPAAAIPRGRGIVGFPLALLNIPDARDSMLSVIRKERDDIIAAPSPRRWAEAKATILKSAHDIYAEHRLKRRHAVDTAEAAVAAADLLFMSNFFFFLGTRETLQEREPWIRKTG